MNIENHKPYFSQSLTELTPELLAMRVEDVLPIRHDIHAAVNVALGAMRRLRQEQERVRARFGDAAAAYIDRIELTARAAAHAHAMHLTSLHGADTEVMAGRLTQLRAVLTLEVQALIARGLVPASVLAELVGGTSYKGLSLDVLQLVAILRRTEAQAKTGVTTAELDLTETLANAFTTALGEEHVGSDTSETAEMRRRAYTLFFRTYEEARRQVAFLHWKDGRADDIAPPLSTMHGGAVTEAPVSVG